MRRSSAILGSLLFLLLAPGFVVGVVPWWITSWQFSRLSPVIAGVRVLGAALMAAGVALLLDSFARFAWNGLGTPAPVAPPRQLVVTGLYRFVRNPMYLAVVAAILGQGLLFGNTRLCLYGLGVWAACHLFVILYEEPKLRGSFGSEYQRFSEHVPRWVPRVRPWQEEQGEPAAGSPGRDSLVG
jgi:protein-S-isoprenylcysteine O-methyltransferase Ste14